VLISVSTTMVGPMTFFGFIVATLAYQLAGSSQHRVVLPFAVLLGMATLLGGYFVLRHVFYAAGMLSIIIEFVGGVFFLVYLLRKGSL
jgi:iron complex transport system permease protein